ncbi:MAG TPA: ferric uptake regulator family protein [Gammaproteobacteria bacterium]|nr:ferric uptake regulator family protein [Gammaproteobacteria bacterium]
MRYAERLSISSRNRESPCNDLKTMARSLVDCAAVRSALKRVPQISLSIMTLAFSGDGMANHTPLSFAEPYSGKKVSGYQVTLPVKRSEKRLFNVPEACEEVVSAFTSGASQWGTRIEQRMWWKVWRDCQYYGFLHRFPQKTVVDYVSNYDFMNAYLRDIPMGARCANVVDPANVPGCEPFPPGIPDPSRFLPFVDRGTEKPELDVAPCRIKDGIFRGRIVQDQDGLHCEPDESAPGFRVISVDHADVNGDGYLDVVLRLIPLGHHTGRAPLLLPLTRTQPDGIFTVPRGTALPEVPGNP